MGVRLGFVSHAGDRCELGSDVYDFGMGFNLIFVSRNGMFVSSVRMFMIFVWL